MERKTIKQKAQSKKTRLTDWTSYVLEYVEQKAIAKKDSEERTLV